MRNTGKTRKRHQVAVVQTGAAVYPQESPYHPSERYPEYAFSTELSSEANQVYAGVRQLFHQLGYDKDRYGTQEWNPLEDLISPGNTIFIKPNFVLSRHYKGGSLWAIVTHPSVLRAVIDYAWIALRGEGKIILGDAPQYDCNFEELMEAGQFDKLDEFYKSQPGPKFEILDLRKYWSRGKHFTSMLIPLSGDPRGSLVVNLGKQSALQDIANPDNLYGAVYDRDETIRHHTGDRQEYEVSRTIMEADVVISVPKLKVHKKVGVTLNIKGLVGINTNKNLIVHYRVKPPKKGGDQYPDNLFTPVERFLIQTERWMYDHFLTSKIKSLEYLHRSIYWIHNHTTKKLGLKVADWKRLQDAGNWYGNDSAWRMAVDLIRIFYFVDRNGQLHKTLQRRIFSVIDGVIGGENNGPLMPDAKPAGVLIGGENCVAVDTVGARLMGFDPHKMKMFRAVFEDTEYDFGVHGTDDVEVITDIPEWQDCLQNFSDRYLAFKPHPGWIGHLEIDQN